MTSLRCSRIRYYLNNDTTFSKINNKQELPVSAKVNTP